MRAVQPLACSMLLLAGFGLSGAARADTTACTDRGATRQVICLTLAATTVDTSQQLGFAAWLETRDSLNTNNWYRVPGDIQIKDSTHAIVSGGTNSLQNETFTGLLPVFGTVGTVNLYAYSSAWASSPTIAVTINKYSPAFAPTTSTTLSRVGQSVSLNANVNLERPTGVLVFYVRPPGGTTTEVARKTESYPSYHIIDYDPRTYTLATAGEYAFSWAYLGDALNLSKTSPEVKVRVGPFVTSTALTQSVAQTLTSKPVTLTAAISGAQIGVALPSGNVDFYDGATLLGTAALDGQGSAALTTTQLSATGTHPLTARYAGDYNYQASTSAAVAHEVQFDPALVVPVLDLLLSDPLPH